MSAIRAMIVSVGGSIEPLITTVQDHRPELVVFFASEQTVELIGAIKDRLREAACRFRDRKVITGNPEDIVACYTDALSCADLVTTAGYGPSDVAVDFTGGTKVMSAALALATVGKGFTFAYVGGRERSKDGIGVVLAGSETIVRRADPFVLLQVDERRAVAGCFRNYQFAAAQALLDGLLLRALGEADRLAFTMLRRLAAGYEAWERFDYPQAVQALKATLREWTPAVIANQRLFGAAAQATVEKNVDWLDRLQCASNHFTHAAPEFVTDMVANAGRRAEEGKYDDAVVRLYRALELGGQVAVCRRLGCRTDAVPVDRVPEPLQSEFRSRYERKSGLFELPLQATYRLLESLGEPEGLRFAERADAFRKIQSARNQSWLAHGMTPTARSSYESLRSLVTDLLGVRETVVFPRLTTDRDESCA